MRLIITKRFVLRTSSNQEFPQKRHWGVHHHSIEGFCSYFSTNRFHFRLGAIFLPRNASFYLLASSLFTFSCVAGRASIPEPHKYIISNDSNFEPSQFLINFKIFNDLFCHLYFQHFHVPL